MTDHIVSLPDGGDSSSRREAIALVAVITRFAAPERFPSARDLEYSLSARYSSLGQVQMADISAWLAEAGVAAVDLAAEIAQASAGNPDALRALLHTQNDQGMIQLLHLADASQLVTDGGLHVAAQPVACFALRSGYTDSDPYGYYRLSLPGYDRTDVRLAWGSVVAARPDGGLAVAAAKPPVDAAAAQNALEIAEQAMIAVQNAHASIKSALGL